MVDVAPRVQPRVGPARPSSVALVRAQAGYALRLFWRRPVAAVFTLIFPLSLLVVVNAVVGNQTLDTREGIRVAQFMTPVFAVFGICMASFSILPTGVATARESGVLQRLRGTPLQPWKR